MDSVPGATVGRREQGPQLPEVGEIVPPPQKIEDCHRPHQRGNKSRPGHPFSRPANHQQKPKRTVPQRLPGMARTVHEGSE
jgi:hypothetical protein